MRRPSRPFPGGGSDLRRPSRLFRLFSRPPFSRAPFARRAAALAAMALALATLGAGCFCDPQDPEGFVYSCSDPRRPECPPNQRCGLCTGGELMGLYVCGPLPATATVTCAWMPPAGALTAADLDPFPADVNLDGVCDTVLLPRTPPPDPTAADPAARAPTAADPAARAPTAADPAARAPAAADPTAWVVLGIPDGTGSADPLPLSADLLAAARPCD